MSAKDRQRFARGHIPQPHRLVASAGGKNPPVGGERDCIDTIRVSGKDVQLLSGKGVPNSRGRIVACGRQQPAIGGESHATHQGVMAGQGQLIGVTQPPQIEPLKAPKILFTRLGPVLIQQLFHAVDVAFLPGLKRDVHV